MYGSLTAPAFGIKFKGLIWYQGESNDSAPERYYELFKAFVNMYRERCGYEIPVILHSSAILMTLFGALYRCHGHR